MAVSIERKGSHLDTSKVNTILYCLCLTREMVGGPCGYDEVCVLGDMERSVGLGCDNYARLGSKDRLSSLVL